MISSSQPLDDRVVNLIVEDIIAILNQFKAATLTAYTAFATELVPNPDLERRLGAPLVTKMFRSINYKLLALSLDTAISSSKTMAVVENTDHGLWLLARFIFAHNEILQPNGSATSTYDMDFIRVVSALLSALADEVSTRIDLDDIVMESPSGSSSRKVAQPLPRFVKDQIKSLVQQGNVSSLLTRAISSHSKDASSKDAQALATYALTLLRVFPAKADDIRSWLFLSSGTSSVNGSSRISPIRFFWQSTRRTEIFAKITKDQKLTLKLLKPPSDVQVPEAAYDQWNKEWQIILLFLELYTFILKFMDDEEFLNGAQATLSSAAEIVQSWTKEGALPLQEVKTLSIFLKNLAFTLYWNASDLTETDRSADEETLRSYFAASSNAKSLRPTQEKQKTQNLAGILGIAQKYLKELVTGLLRSIHERE